jgi:hypothetical protein
MIRNIVLVSFLILITSGLLAQRDFRPGYIISYNNDTTFGRINYKGELFMSRECEFRDTISENVNLFLPDDILAYRFIDGKYYVSREVDGSKVFMEFLINGEINIYSWRHKYGDHFFIEDDSTSLTEIPFEEGIRYIDDKPVFFESTKHTGVLLYFMKDAPELESRIKSIKKPDQKNLIKLAEDYHNIVCQDEECIIYEANKSPVFIELLFEAGYLNMNFDKVTDVLKQENHIDLNLVLYIGMPRVNENLYFKTGIQYKGVIADSVDVKYNVFTFPFAMEYRFQKRKFQPTLGFGFGFEKVKWYTYFLTSANVGFKYKMDDFYVSTILNTDIRVSRSPVFPASSWFSFYLNVGLGYRF